MLPRLVEGNISFLILLLLLVSGTRQVNHTLLLMTLQMFQHRQCIILKTRFISALLKANELKIKLPDSAEDWENVCQGF
jgi:hypothetical protein